jgi:putative aminopeptidase FrvX
MPAKRRPPTRKPAPKRKPQRAQAPVRHAGLGLLARLSEAAGVSGDESAVRKIILAEVSRTAAETRIDALGNLLVRCRTHGKPRLRLMIAAHMDEVGLMIVRAGAEGLWKFETVGGVDVRALPAQAVTIGRERIPGVIGVKPIHLTEKDEIDHPLKVDGMTIDIGAKDKDGAMARLKPGDRAVFATAFRNERGILRGKALDDRLGVAALIELASDPPPGLELWAAFTVQEEIGLRGATVAAHAIDPDLAIVLDATPAHDMPAWDGGENAIYNTKLGCGPAIYLTDRGTISDARLVRLLAGAAEKEDIPYQFRQPGSGGTDAGAIHLARQGVPAVSISVPCRNVHTPVSTARLDDWRGLTALVWAAIRQLGRTGLDSR